MNISEEGQAVKAAVHRFVEEHRTDLEIIEAHCDDDDIVVAAAAELNDFVYLLVKVPPSERLVASRRR